MSTTTSTINLTLDATQVEKALSELGQASMEMYISTETKLLETYAKANRPWKDRTSHAKQRLTGEYEKNARGYTITLAHGVDYGLWLELAKEKKYAILEPTVRLQGPEVVRGMVGLLERL